MAFTTEMLKRVVTEGITGSEDHYRTGGGSTLVPKDAGLILEIACMTVTSDGKIADDELAAVKVMSAMVHAFAGTDKGALSEAVINAVLDRCSALRSPADRETRLRVVAKELSGTRARHLAYKISMATAMADLASSDEEFEFDIALLDALELTNEIGDALAGEVHEALTQE